MNPNSSNLWALRRPQAWLWYISLYSLTIPSSSLTCLSFYPRSLQPDLLIYDSLTFSFGHSYRRYTLFSYRSEDVSHSLILILSISSFLFLRIIVKSLTSPRYLSYHYLITPIPSCVSYQLNPCYPPSPKSLSPQNTPSTLLLIYCIPSSPLLNDGFLSHKPPFPFSHFS